MIADLAIEASVTLRVPTGAAAMLVLPTTTDLVIHFHAGSGEILGSVGVPYARRPPIAGTMGERVELPTGTASVTLSQGTCAAVATAVWFVIPWRAA